jgi:hypothetical protein
MRGFMRSITPPPLPTAPLDDALTVAEWLRLPVAVRIAHRLSEVAILLSMVRDELQSEGASRLLWMEDDIGRAFDDTDRVLRRLSV